jgi:hypothetical protein
VTVKDLVLRYEVDVLTRIETLEEEKADIAKFANHGEDLFKDLDDQIAHWNATLADILTVIDREGFRSK